VDKSRQSTCLQCLGLALNASAFTNPERRLVPPLMQETVF
jgi:hypothetical protein